MTICQRQSGGRILCVRLSGLGDVVHTLNALSLLRKERPQAHITWVVEERFSDLLGGHRCIDELLVVPRLRWGAMLKNPLRWKRFGGELRQFVKDLRRREFEASVDFQSSLKSAWIVAAAGAPLKVGFARPVSRELSHLFQTVRVQAPKKGVHRIERYLALLAPLGIATRYAQPLVHFDEEAAREMERSLPERRGDGPLVVIHPGTSRFAAFKRWLPARYAIVADRLIEEFGAHVLVTWGPGDRHLAEQVVLLMKRPGTLAPRTERLQELVCLVSRADLFIGSDTGPMHLAAAAGTPVVALFGPKDPTQSGPYCSRSLVVTGTAPCRPCTRRRCRDPRCMTSISSGQVLSAARGVLEGEGERRARPGPIRAAFSRPFRLGPWSGEVNSAYSCAEFFRWLCRPDRILRSGEPWPAAPDRERKLLGDWRLAERPPEGLPRAPLIVERFSRRLREARHAWRSAGRLHADGASLGFPVGYMEAVHRGRGTQLLITERPDGAVPLSVWLAQNAPGSSEPEREALPGALAEAVGSLHAERRRVGRLQARDLFVQTNGEGELSVGMIGAGTTHRTGWLPPPARAYLYGVDLGKLAADLEGRLSEEHLRTMLEAYRQEFTQSRSVRAMLKRGFERGKETDSWLSRFLSW